MNQGVRRTLFASARHFGGISAALLALAATGCAYQRQIAEGDASAAKGDYAEAISRYQAAEEATQTIGDDHGDLADSKIRQAKSAWAASLAAKADDLEREKHPGGAWLLLAKASSLDPKNPQYAKEAQAMRAQIRSWGDYPVVASPSGDLARQSLENLEQSLDKDSSLHLVFAPSAPARAVLQLALAEPSYQRETHEEMRTTGGGGAQANGSRGGGRGGRGRGRGAASGNRTGAAIASAPAPAAGNSSYSGFGGAVGLSQASPAATGSSGAATASASAQPKTASLASSSASATPALATPAVAATASNAASALPAAAIASNPAPVSGNILPALGAPLPVLSAPLPSLGNPAPVLRNPVPGALGSGLPALGNVLPTLANPLPAIGNARPAIGNVSPALGNVSPALGNPSAAYGNPSPGSQGVTASAANATNGGFVSGPVDSNGVSIALSSAAIAPASAGGARIAGTAGVIVQQGGAQGFGGGQGNGGGRQGAARRGGRAGAPATYPVTVATLTANSEARGIVAHGDGRPPISIDVPLESVGRSEGNDAQRAIGVPAHPMEPINREMVSAFLVAQSAEAARRALEASFQSWRGAVLAGAEQAQTPEDKLDRYAVYALSDPREVDPGVRERIDKAGESYAQIKDSSRLMTTQ